MDWAYPILLVILIGWAFQMVMEYRRKADRLRADILNAREAQQHVSGEALEAEEQLGALQEQLRGVEARASDMGNQERELQEQVSEMKRKRVR